MYLTFEHLLGKKADSSYLPDYGGIEIKTTLRFSRYSIGLFSLSFDGPEKYESNCILQKYGLLDEQYNEKYMNITLHSDYLTEFNDHYFKLNVNYHKKRLEIIVFDKNKCALETRGYISFRRLRRRIKTKVKYLAVIGASKKVDKENLYFRYYKINCYVYKSFKTFLNLIESGDLETTLLLRFARSGNDIGKNKNKSMTFRIKKESIDKLFNLVYSQEK